MRLVLVVALFYQIGSFLVFVHEGSECMLENGDKGVCKTIWSCPTILKEVQEQKRDWGSPGRCGFDNFTEIVCCAQDDIRPAEMACNEYQVTRRMRRWTYSVPVIQPKLPTVILVQCGVPSADGEFPFAVALGYKDIDNDASPIRYSCGGSLISYEHVLTSAHCVRNTKNAVPIEVRLGDRDLNGTKAISIPISRFFVHPKYKFYEDYYDVVIIKLQTALRTITKYIAPVCLLTKPISYTNLKYGKLVTAIGWGDTSHGSNDGSNRLLMTPRLGIVPNDECAKYYQNSPKLPNGLDDSLICAMDQNIVNTSDTCQGDSGGPLLTDDHKLFGITTAGNGCAMGYPGIYTAVYRFLDWIEEIVWPNLKKVQDVS